MELDLRTNEVEIAIGNIERRAEREKDYRKLYDIYVDRGVLTELSAKENQVVYGRRGVGKTHLFHFYRDHLLSSSNRVLFQIHNCQELGSGLNSVSSNSAIVAESMFREFLNDIATESFEALDTIELHKEATQNAGSAILAFQEVIDRSPSSTSSFDFRNLGATLDKFRISYGAERFIIALDEWVAVPPTVQPFFAELLKHTFFSQPEFVIKIAAVTYQSKMSAEYNGRIIGLETGADVFGDIDLDTYFVWEEDKVGVQLFFAQVLYNHIADSLSWHLDVNPNDKISIIQKTFFTQEDAFVQLCRAAEGNCRDLLNVFRCLILNLREMFLLKGLVSPILRLLQNDGIARISYRI
jgi:hypothetical protein